jgi:hypothetical protein
LKPEELSFFLASLSLQGALLSDHQSFPMKKVIREFVFSFFGRCLLRTLLNFEPVMGCMTKGGIAIGG